MKKAIAIFTIIILVFLIKNIIFSISTLIKHDNRVENLTNQLEAKKKESEFLKQKLFYVKSDEFVEKEARTKLGLIKKDEYIVIIPPLPGEAQKKADPTIDVSNPQKWFSLFF